MNDNCNGKATGHFDEGLDLSTLIPNCGCYFGDSLHYKYFIDSPMTIYIGINNISANEYEITVKKHILEKELYVLQILMLNVLHKLLFYLKIL